MSAGLCKNIFKNLSKEIILNKVKHNGAYGQYQMFARSKVTKPKPDAPEEVVDRAVRKTKLMITDDGIYKNRGQLTDIHTTADGKPVYPGRWKWQRKPEGTEVLAGENICYQKRLNYHPGLNVAIGRDLTLYSYENGVIYITWEKVRFNFDHKFVNDFYYDQKDMNVFKPYYHVICKPQTKHFRLVDRI